MQSTVSEVLWSKVASRHSEFTSLCGVPYNALPLATVSTQGKGALMGSLSFCVFSLVDVYSTQCAYAYSTEGSQNIWN